MLRRASSVVAVLLALAVFGASAPASGQTSLTSGAVRGQVVGPDGEAVTDAPVMLRDVERGVTREVRTDGEGRFTFGLLLPGTYLWAVRGPDDDLDGGTAGPVRVRAAQRSTVRARIEPGEYVYAETGEPLGMEVNPAGMVELVDRTQLENLPLEARDWKTLFLLSGLVSLAEDGGFELSGSRGLPVLVDGREQ